MSDETLKPCPFCGGEATIEVKTEWYDYDGGDRWWIYQADITCDSCDAMMHVDHYKPKKFTDWATAEQFAIEAWNTRAEHTCRNIAQYTDESGKRVCNARIFCCSSCGFKADDFYGDGEESFPRYCPNCGRKVVDE